MLLKTIVLLIFYSKRAKKTTMGENNKTKGPGQQESLLEVDSTSPDLGHGVADKKVTTSKITDFVKQQNEKHRG